MNVFRVLLEYALGGTGSILYNWQNDKSIIDNPQRNFNLYLLRENVLLIICMSIHIYGYINAIEMA